MKIVKCTIRCFFLLLVTALFWAMPATTWGYTVTKNNVKYELNDSKMTASATGYSGPPTAVTIPAVINDGDKDYTVTSIGGFAFCYCTSLTSIEIPASVTSIEDFAFSECNSLTSIEIPASVTYIGDSAFSGCARLISIEIPAGVTEIRKGAFEKCTSLASVTFAEGSKLESIGDYAFWKCKSLASIKIPASVTEIGRRAFEKCTSLASVTFAEGSKLKRIGDYAFDSCTSLASIKIPASVTTIGRGAFDPCTKVIWADNGTGIGKIPAIGFNDPKISFNFIEGKLVLAFTGTLEGSEDGKQWTAINAASPYTVEMTGGKKFFRAVGVQGGSELGGTESVEVGKNFIIPLSDTVNLEMIWVNPGTFKMGSPKGESGRYSDETQHQVTLTKGYWLGKYEVTQEQYKAVMGNTSWLYGKNLPVEMVSWTDATIFCVKLTEIERAAGRLPEGYEYRLPTEAQWEYACRAGTTTALNNGRNLTDVNECFILDVVGWYGGNSDGHTHPVGGKQPNAWGFYDMHGNVWEWCMDWYDRDYPTGNVTDPTGPATGSRRVRRGGGWRNRADRCRSAFRCSYDPSYDFNGGLRVALSPVQ